MKNLFRTCLAVLLAVSFFLSVNISICEAESGGIPEIIESGLKEYKSKGAKAAIKAWIKGSPFEGSKQALSQANSFNQIETFYGAYKGYFHMHTSNLTPTTKIVYLTMNFENGPVFTVFTVFKSQKGWILTGKFNFHTKPNKIFPEFLLKK